MAFQYADQVFMAIGPISIEIAELSFDSSFDQRSAVKSMNPSGRPLGHRRAQGETTFTVKVPQRAGLPDWPSIEGETIHFQQRVDAAPDYTALGAFYKSHSGSTTDEGEQAIDIEFGCLNWREGL